MLFNILMTVDEYVTYKHRGDMLTGVTIILIMIIGIVLHFMRKDR